MLLLICPRCLAFVGLGNFLQAVSTPFVVHSRRQCAAQIHTMGSHLVTFPSYLLVEE